MAWTKEARAAAAAKRRARGPRSGAKGYRDKVVAAKEATRSRGMTANSFAMHADYLTTRKKGAWGSVKISRQAASIKLDRALQAVKPMPKSTSTPASRMNALKGKLTDRKDAGKRGAADQIWSAMKRGK